MTRKMTGVAAAGVAGYLALTDVGGLRDARARVLKADLRIGFADGGHWAFEIPKIYGATAERLVAALGDGVSQEPARVRCRRAT